MRDILRGRVHIDRRTSFIFGDWFRISSETITEEGLGQYSLGCYMRRIIN